MADRGMVAALVETGIPAEDATDMIERVFGALAAQLAASKPVVVAGVGQLRLGPVKPAWVPGSVKRKAIEQRKVVLSRPAVVPAGAPYDVASPVDRQVAAYEMGRAVRETRNEGKPDAL